MSVSVLRSRFYGWSQFTVRLMAVSVYGFRPRFTRRGLMAVLVLRVYGPGLRMAVPVYGPSVYGPSVYERQRRNAQRFPGADRLTELARSFTLQFVTK